MGVDYDSKAVFGWEIDETNEDKFCQVLKEVFNINGSEDFSFWKSEQVENMKDIIKTQLGLPFNLTLTGNFYYYAADSFELLFGKNCEGNQLAEVINWFENNKEILLKIEKIMEKPPRFINEPVVLCKEKIWEYPSGLIK